VFIWSFTTIVRVMAYCNAAVHIAVDVYEDLKRH
jgi:hypothetical protein